MAEYGEWNRKGTTLSDATALKEYGVSRDFIVKGIREGELEYREATMCGNPYLRILRSQLEKFIAKEQGAGQLASAKNLTELRKVKRETTQLKKKLAALEFRKIELDAVESKRSKGAETVKRSVKRKPPKRK